MKKDSITNRKDIVTNEVLPRTELIRISIQKDGKTELDYEFNKGGRGIYIKPSSIEDGFKKGFLLRNIKRFNGNLEQISDELKEAYNG